MTNTIRLRRITEPVLSPEAAMLGAQGSKEGSKLAERLDSLKGARIGFFNNHKPFAALSLASTERFLKTRGVSEIFTSFATMSNKPTEETLAELAAADAVVLAGAD